MDHQKLAIMSRRRSRKQVQRHKRSKVWAVSRVALSGLVSASLASLAAFFGLFGYTYTQVSEDLPELSSYSATELAQTSVVYDSDGNMAMINNPAPSRVFKIVDEGKKDDKKTEFLGWGA